MKIKDLHVYGYGKLENQRFLEMGQLQVFFGENESGKSTIMSFIHSLLFGFPTKVQNVRRYEPKLHAKYGGRLTLITKKDGEVIIERVKGKATGDVKITFQDGRTGGEEELNEILHGMDKNYYQSIFSFDLQGLQGLSALSEGDMSKYLLSAGLIGNDRLLEAETKLQKEMDLRFKPSGQKPLLNVKIKELKELEKQVKAAEVEQQSYTVLCQDEIELKSQLSSCLEQIQEMERKLVESSSFLRIKPLFEERREIEARLNDIGDMKLPSDGLRRLEQLQAVEVPLNAQLAALNEKVRKIERDLMQNESGSFLRKNKEKVEFAIEQGAMLDKLELEIRKVEHEIQAEAKKIERIKQDLFWDAADQHISKLDTSTFMKEKIKRAEREKHHLHQNENLLDEKYSRQKVGLDTTEARMKELKAKLMPSEKRNELEAIVNKRQDSNFDEVKRQFLDEQISELEGQLDSRKKRQDHHKRFHLLTGGLIILICVIAIGSFVKGQSLGGFILLSAAIVLAVSRFLSKGDDSLVGQSAQLEQAKRKRAALDRVNKSQRDMSAEAMKQLINQDDDFQKQLDHEMFKYKEREDSFESTIQEYAAWEERKVQLLETVNAIMTSWGFPHPGSDVNLESAFDELVKWKAAVERKNEYIETHRLLKADFHSISDALFDYALQIGKEPSTWKDAILTLKKEVHLMADQTAKFVQCQQVLRDLMSEKESLMLEKDYLEKEKAKLLTKAKVDSEEAYREKAILADERIMLQKQWKLLNIQLEQADIQPERIQRFSEQGINVYSVENLEQRRKDLVKEKTVLLENQADTRYKIKQLEANGVYEELLHRFHEAKAAFNEEAKEWAKLALAKGLLNKTLDRYKRERLPKVIAEAEQHLVFLTNGRYQRIILEPKGEGLRVERSDGLNFEAEEVSRGTAEQIYVSLRLALADHTFAEDPFPLIIDDSFVNFDGKRTKRMLELLNKVSQRRQVLFFTCHDHNLHHFEGNDVIHLSKQALTPK
ncbi:AAA family ATPase [Peribacillus sp. NPDC097198]|uniref:ATP-binding protein n=1 Tax=Peribacillus sp. NPDC097198 TaxID=3364397 RepID=UPI0038033C8B